MKRGSKRKQQTGEAMAEITECLEVSAEDIVEIVDIQTLEDFWFEEPTWVGEKKIGVLSDAREFE